MSNNLENIFFKEMYNDGNQETQTPESDNPKLNAILSSDQTISVQYIPLEKREGIRNYIGQIYGNYGIEVIIEFEDLDFYNKPSRTKIIISVIGVNDITLAAENLNRIKTEITRRLMNGGNRISSSLSEKLRMLLCFSMMIRFLLVIVFFYLTFCLLTTPIKKEVKLANDLNNFANSINNY